MAPARTDDTGWDVPTQESARSSTVTTTGHSYVITYGENIGETVMDT